MKRASILSMLLLACACASAPPAPRPQPPPAPIAFFEKSCRDIWQQELFRAIDDGGLKGCLSAFLSGQTGEQVRAGVQASAEWKEAHKPRPELQAVHVDDRIFRTEDGQPWRWKGVSAFKLLDLYARGQDIRPFLMAYKGFNVLRVWPYVQGPGWGTRGWEPPSVEVIKEFLESVARDGWLVELTLLTDDEPARLAWAKTLVSQLAAAPRPMNLILEGGNEPDTHKAIKTAELKSVLEASGFMYASGNYEDSQKIFGDYLVHHSARSSDWPRRAHDCVEFWSGGGPNKPTDPAHRIPCVLDEPAKMQDVGFNEDDWRAYFGAASLMGAGATFHSETGKFAQLPTEQEQKLIAAALEGLNAFPDGAPLGAYRRIVEPGQSKDARTYVIGPYMVRSQQRGDAAPEEGWTRIGTSSVLWRR